MTITGNKSLSLGLSFVAGAGVILMILALGVGVVQGAAANGTILNLTFLAGLALLILGVAAWMIVVRPFDHFDDINVAQYTGHAHAHEEHHDEAHDTEEAHADAQHILPPG